LLHLLSTNALPTLVRPYVFSLNRDHRDLHSFPTRRSSDLIPYRVPPAHLLPERTAAVLGVLYLTFNEGYSASAGPDLLRPDLARSEERRVGKECRSREAPYQ